MDQAELSVRRQCELLGLPRSSLYYQPVAESEENLRLMRLLDEEYTAHPFQGSRKMTVWLEMLEEALSQGRPEVFNTDQGVQFTAEAFTGRLVKAGVAVSMDGKGRCLDNVFVERLWRTVKYEELYLRCYETVPQLQHGLTRYFGFYNEERFHQSLEYQTPAQVYRHGRIRE